MNISTDHGPSPHICISFLAAAASGIFFNESRSSELSVTAAAIAFNVFVFAPESPVFRNSVNRVFRIAAGDSRIPQTFLTRARIVSAAAVPSCCEITIATNDAKHAELSSLYKNAGRCA